MTPLPPSKGRCLPPETTLADYFENIYARMKLGGRSQSTKRLYRITIKNFGEFLEREPTLADLNDDTVTMLLSWLLETKRSPRTANKHRDGLLALWRYACRKRHIDADWPDVEPAPEYKRIPQAWSIEQYETLLRAASETPGMVGGVLARLWWPALILTLYDTGARIGALVKVKWSDVDLAERTLLLRAENQKQRADQMQKLHPQTVATLETIRQPERDYVFAWPWTKTYLWVHYKKIVQRAGLPDDRMSNFHRIRKTAATQIAIKCGLHAATKLLGHADVKTTAKYIDPTKMPDDATADNLPRPMIEAKPTAATPGIEAKRLVDLLPDFLAMLEKHGSSMKVHFAARRFVARSEIETVTDLTPQALAAYFASVAGEVSEKTLFDYREGVTWFVAWLLEVHGCARMADCLATIGSRVSHIRPPWRKEAKGGAA